MPEAMSSKIGINIQNSTRIPVILEFPHPSHWGSRLSAADGMLLIYFRPSRHSHQKIVAEEVPANDSE
jgi:hypothetical protein